MALENRKSETNITCFQSSILVKYFLVFWNFLSKLGEAIHAVTSIAWTETKCSKLYMGDGGCMYSLLDETPASACTSRVVVASWLAGTPSEGHL